MQIDVSVYHVHELMLFCVIYSHTYSNLHSDLVSDLIDSNLFSFDLSIMNDAVKIVLSLIWFNKILLLIMF